MNKSILILFIGICACSQPKDSDITSLSSIEIGDQFEFVKFDFTDEPDSLYLGRMMGRNIQPGRIYTLESIKVNPMGTPMYWFRDNENNSTKAFDRYQAGMVLVSKAN